MSDSYRLLAWHKITCDGSVLILYEDESNRKYLKIGRTHPETKISGPKYPSLILEGTL